MPRVITEADLSPEQQARRRKEREVLAERQKDPTTLTLLQRVERLERILHVETGGG